MDIEKLSIVSNTPINELKEILEFFNTEGFLIHKDNFKRIQLSSKAKEIQK